MFAKDFFDKALFLDNLIFVSVFFLFDSTGCYIYKTGYVVFIIVLLKIFYISIGRFDLGY